MRKITNSPRGGTQGAAPVTGLPSPGDRLLAIRAVLGFILAGLVVGALARILVPGRAGVGLGRTLAVCVLGAVVGWLVATAIGGGELLELDLVGLGVAAATALALVVAGLRLGLLARRDAGRPEAP